MRICVFGAGSLGSALGGILAERNNVTLVGRKAHIDAIRRNGLWLTGDIDRCVKVRSVFDVSSVDTPDLLLISTKAYDTSKAIDACRGLVSQETAILTLQNGLGNLELLRAWRGDTAFGGTTTMGATLVSPGVVRISGLGDFIVGGDKDVRRAKEIASTFKACGLRAVVKKGVVREIWGKAVINACINPTAAVLRVRNGELLRSKTTVRFMREVCHECETVASAIGVSLPSERMFPVVRAVCTDTSGNFSSMLQDILRGKRTEIREINGAFCSHGESKDVPTPLNATLVSMVERLQRFTKEKG